MSEVWIGSKLVVSDEEYREHVKSICEKTENIMRSGDSIAMIHNALTTYTVMLLMMSTGQRPVVDPFCYITSFSLDGRFVIVNDKEVSMRHAERISVVCPTAQIQMNEYHKHLDWLICHLRGNIAWRSLAGAIQRVRNRRIKQKNQTLPLFFFLDEKNNTIKTVSISESSLMKYRGIDWLLPENYNRHNLSTQIRKSYYKNKQESLSITHIESQLGHMEGQKHPYGVNAIDSPERVYEILSTEIESVIKSQGWTVINSRHAFCRPQIINDSNWLHTSSPLGPVVRRQNRKAEYTIDNDLVDACINEVIDESLSYTSENLEKIRELVTERSEASPERLRVRHFILWKRLFELKKKDPGIRLPKKFIVLKFENSPFTSQYLYHHDRVSLARQSLVTYLEDKGRNIPPSKLSDIYQCRAEISVAAALFDGICNPKILESLSSSSISITHELDLMYVNIFDGEGYLVWRWFPGEFCSAMLSGLSRKLNCCEFKVSDSSTSRDTVNRILQSLGIDCSANNTYRHLCEISSSYWGMYLPPVLREVAIGNVIHTTLAEECLIRLVRKNKNSMQIREDVRKIDTFSELIIRAGYIKQSSHTHSNAAASKKLIDNIFAQAEKMKGYGGKSRRRVRLEYVEQTFRDELSVVHSYPSIAVAIMSWSIKLCSKGKKRKPKLAYNTIRNYTKYIAKILVEQCCTYNIFTLDDDEYEIVYQTALEISKYKDKSIVLDNLKDLHSLLVHNNLAPEIDWSYSAGYVYGTKIASTTYNKIISYNEYSMLIEEILCFAKNGGIYNKKYLMYGTLVILGYRFGLRIGEATRLEYRDIQISDIQPYYIIHIRNTKHGETKSDKSRRQVPLIGDLSVIEREFLERILISDSVSTKDSQALVFHSDSDPRQQLDTIAASQITNSLLKNVTGDDSAHHHMLRHSFNSRIFTHMLDFDSWMINPLKDALHYENDVDIVEFLTGSKSHTHKACLAHSVLTGHADITTTISNYIHTCDLLINIHTRKHNYKHTQNVSSIDCLLAYCLHSTPQAIAKSRTRLGIASGEFHRALSALTRKHPAPSSSIATEPYTTSMIELIDTPENVVIMPSLIDEILVLSKSLNTRSLDILSQRLLAEQKLIKSVLDSYDMLANSSGYSAYNINDNKPKSGSKPDLSETICVRHYLSGHIKLGYSPLTEADLYSLRNGMNSWAEGFYPSTRYNPIIFATPSSAIDYLEALKLLGITPDSLTAYCSCEKSTWFSLADDIDSQSLTLITSAGEEIKYEFSKATTSTSIPLPLSKKRIQGKERISISLAKKLTHPLTYQKRLDRLCAVVYVWLRTSVLTG